MKMLDLNNVPEDNKSGDFELIPVGTVVRAIVKLKGGTTELPEFGQGQWFKTSASSKAKWAEIEFTIVGGPYDRRKVWDNIFVDGDKLGESGMPMAKEIGLRTLKGIIDSAFSLDPSDQSENAQNSRKLSGIGQLNEKEICMKVGVKKGTNGYADQNKMMVALTPNNKDFISSSGGSSTVAATAPAQAQTVTGTLAPQGNVPSWAQS
tara:strand:+ start:4475 stop:5095 length:621 start_codon:yes stop_codon:yes gene_type:complete